MCNRLFSISWGCASASLLGIAFLFVGSSSELFLINLKKIDVYRFIGVFRDSQQTLRRLSADSHQILIRFSADSQQILSRFSADSQQSQQILSIFCCCRWHRQNCLKVPQWKFVSSMSLIAANSRQILVRFLSDSRQILISVLSDSRQILVTMVVFKTIVTYINSPLPWRLKAFSVLLKQ